MREDLQLQEYPVIFGADPEGFFTNNQGRIVGSELVIPKVLKDIYNYASVVRDGVQLEIHVQPDECREVLASNIEDAFRLIQKHLDQQEDFKFSFQSVIRMTPGEMNKLSAKSRQLGCAPSENIYNADAKIGVNPRTYKVRSAGGHVHLGIRSRKLKAEYPRIIRACDILLGNQAVLMDREPMMKLRRRVYGRAGECRPQKYGVEYRTLSNFWLRNEPLVSFVLAMARNAVSIIATTDGIECEKLNLEKALFDYINLKKIIKAINDNDFDLAMRNFEGIERFIIEHLPENIAGLNKKNVRTFRYFVNKINEKGIEFWFPKGPMEHWNAKNKGGLACGWESYMNKISKEVPKGY